MSNLTPSKPSFVFGYWRPWKENSNLYDSYLDYSRDTSLVIYGADTVGQYINQASKEQVKSINMLGQAIGRGMNVLSNQMSDINETLVFLNRNMDVQIEQQKLSNLLLQNIAELLRVPDSEKERQHSIELGIKFFVNASKEADLFADALEELLKAESLMKQDYFVLHRIGCIYLYAEKFINPEKGLEYFVRAAKYASVESDINAARLANVLTNNFHTVNTELNNSEKQIGLLVADSYEKAAFSAYILGRFSEAVNYQIKALKFNAVPQNRFLLAKYQVRNGEISEGVKNLSICIDDEPILAVASFKEIDLINEPEVVNLILIKNKIIDNKINNLRVKWEKNESIETSNILKELAELSQKSFEIKASKFNLFEKKTNEIKKNIDAHIIEIKNSKFCTYKYNIIELFIDELLKAEDLPFDKMLEVFQNIKKQVDEDKLIIGAKFAGGIVFYIDNTGEHGLVFSQEDFGEAVWGSYEKTGAYGNGVSDGSGLENTKKASLFAKKGFFFKKTAPTAAVLCLGSNYNGFSDWYLPTVKELHLFKLALIGNSLRNIQSVNYCQYWSSVEHDSDNGFFEIAYAVSIQLDYIRHEKYVKIMKYNSRPKDEKNKVLAVRAF
jgi:hypothetical protein